MQLQPSDRVEIIIDTVEDFRSKLAKITAYDDERIVATWNDEIINPLKSILAMAENAEYQLNKTGKGA